MKRKCLIVQILVFAVTLGLSLDNTTFGGEEVLPWSTNEAINSI